jgi:hypothetical protein
MGVGARFMKRKRWRRWFGQSDRFYQLVDSFGAAQAGVGAMKCEDGQSAFLVVSGFACFVMRDYYL